PRLADFFLRTRAGHCEYFATGTVMLLRAAGIPARYAIGYAVHEWSPLERRFIVRGNDAHAWTLAWVGGAWREIDTTPGEWIPTERETASFWTPLGDLWSWATYLFSRWRWSERDDRLTGSIGWLLVPLIALLARRGTRRAPLNPPAFGAHELLAVEQGELRGARPSLQLRLAS